MNYDINMLIKKYSDINNPKKYINFIANFIFFIFFICINLVGLVAVYYIEVVLKLKFASTLALLTYIITLFLYMRMDSNYSSNKRVQYRKSTSYRKQFEKVLGDSLEINIQSTIDEIIDLIDTGLEHENQFHISNSVLIVLIGSSLLSTIVFTFIGNNPSSIFQFAIAYSFSIVFYQIVRKIKNSSTLNSKRENLSYLKMDLIYYKAMLKQEKLYMN